MGPAIDLTEVKGYPAPDPMHEAGSVHPEKQMRAMVLPAPGAPLQMQERPDPIPGDGEIRVKVSACGECRTDLHVVDAELPGIGYPIVPGHEIVGRADEVDAADDFMAGNDGISDAGKLGVDDMKVGPAHPAGAHLDANFSVAWDGVRAFLHLEGRPRSRQHHRTHLFLRMDRTSLMHRVWGRVTLDLCQIYGGSHELEGLLVLMEIN